MGRLRIFLILRLHAHFNRNVDESSPLSYSHFRRLGFVLSVKKLRQSSSLNGVDTVQKKKYITKK